MPHLWCPRGALFYVGCDGTEKSRQKSNQIGQFADMPTSDMAHGMAVTAASFISVNIGVAESKTQKEPTCLYYESLLLKS
jgi:hypothetical protein